LADLSGPPFRGHGLGTLQLVYPPYESLYDGKIVNHTHNDYLEVLAETGLLGGICCAWFLGVLLVQSLERLRPFNNSFSEALQLSGFLACSGFLVHSLVDFNLHIPANALLFFLMAHLATAEIQKTGQPTTSRQRSVTILEIPDRFRLSPCIITWGSSILIQPARPGALVWCFVSTALLGMLVLAPSSRAQQAVLETPQQTNDRIRALSSTARLSPHDYVIATGMSSTSRSLM